VRESVGDLGDDVRRLRLQRVDQPHVGMRVSPRPELVHDGRDRGALRGQVIERACCIRRALAWRSVLAEDAGRVRRPRAARPCVVRSAFAGFRFRRR
jgi:hypothetical protein